MNQAERGRPGTYRVTVKGAVPRDIVERVAQAHATAILTALRRPARDPDQSGGPPALVAKEGNY